MKAHTMILSVLSAGVLIATALPIGFAKTNSCTDLKGQAREHCEEQKEHVASSANSTSGSTMTADKPCRDALHVFMAKRNTDHKEWHRAHRGGGKAFVTLHTAWHKASKAAHKTLKANCGKPSTGSSSLSSSHSSSLSSSASVSSSSSNSSSVSSSSSNSSSVSSSSSNSSSSSAS